MRSLLRGLSALVLGVIVIVPAVRGADTVTTVFSVEGMHCDGCSSVITSTLKGMDGVVRASADHELGVAEAVYDPETVTVDELEAEIEKLGYTVTGTTTAAEEG